MEVMEEEESVARGGYGGGGGMSGGYGGGGGGMGYGGGMMTYVRPVMMIKVKPRPSPMKKFMDKLKGMFKMGR